MTLSNGEEVAETSPSVSVIILTLDPGEALLKLIRRLESQDYPGDLEIRIGDSESRDGSIERVAKEFPRLVIEKFKRERRFNYGRAKNLLLQGSRGDLILFLSQDALPLKRDYVKRMVSPFLENRDVAGVYARQVPHPNLDPDLRKRVEEWTPALPHRLYKRVENWGSFALLPPCEKLRKAAFDNAASAARKELLLSLPFPEIPFGEDLEWSLSMLRMGKMIVYEPGAVVLHSHRRSPAESFRREFLSRRQLAYLFGLKTFGSKRFPLPVLPFLLALPGRYHALLKDYIKRRGEGMDEFPMRLLSEPLILYSEILGQFYGERAGEMLQGELAGDPWEDVFRKRLEKAE